MSDFRTPQFRLSFPYITKQKKNKKTNEDAGYGVSALIPKSDKVTPTFLKELRAEVKAAIKAKFGDNVPNKLKKEFKENAGYPMRDGDDKDLFETWRPEYEGNWVATMNAGKNQPGCLVRRLGAKALNAQELEQEFYAGYNCIASVNVYAYDNESKGASIGLQNLIKMSDGEPLGGVRVAAENDFDDLLEGGEDADDLEDSDYDEDDDL